jgi:hypothetical protein
MSRAVVSALGALTILSAIGCSPPAPPESAAQQDPSMDKRLAQYTPFRLTTDLSALSESERKMLPLLIDAASAMDAAFWRQAYGDRAALLAAIDDPETKRYAEMNYGPWDRLAADEPFVAGVGPKPPGANLYPPDATKDEVQAAAAGSPELLGEYTIVQRDAGGKLVSVPYSRAFAGEIGIAAAKLREAAGLAEDLGLRRYLTLRAHALETDQYRESDVAWLDMKSNTLDIVIGPIETYEDQLLGAKAAFEAFVLVKDKAWSARLAGYAALLPELQRGLPVPAAYKKETPGTDSDLNAYDAVYFAGDCNAGSKTIAINLPNDEQVQLQKGTRRLQLKNAMRAKYDAILVPIAERLIAEDQRRHVTFEAFFAETMFHEVAHGLGIKQTITGRGTVRTALGELFAALEEGKADILGLDMVAKLHAQGKLEGGSIEDYYVTFLAGIFRSVRFGATSAHGRANMVRFHFFEREGAFERDAASGTYRANFERMPHAIAALSEKILRLQGDGDLEGAKALASEMGAIGPTLEADLERLGAAGIPVDVVFEQGPTALGLH